MKDYKDIINIEYDGPKNHVRMTRENRAAQFASFRALTGYEDELKEVRRRVDSKIILSEDKKELLDKKINDVLKNLNKKIKIIYFIKDIKKNGGFYKTIETNIKKIDSVNKEIILINNKKIKIENILDIEIIDSGGNL